MTEGLYYDDLDGPEPAQDTGLTAEAALGRLVNLGASLRAACRALDMAQAAGDGITYLDGTCVSWAEGYGYAVTAPNRTEAGQ